MYNTPITQFIAIKKHYGEIFTNLPDIITDLRAPAN